MLIITLKQFKCNIAGSSKPLYPSLCSNNNFLPFDLCVPKMKFNISETRKSHLIRTITNKTKMHDSRAMFSIFHD